MADAGATITTTFDGKDELTPMMNGIMDGIKSDLPGQVSGINQILQSQVLQQVGQTFTTVFNGAKAAVMDLTSGLDEYVQQVRMVAMMSGTSNDEAARMMEVAEGARVTTEELTQALRMSAQKGITPNIEGLANLADQYNAMGSASDKAAFAQDNFGRGWVNMARLLEKGGDAIRAEAKDVNAALIPTAKMEKQTDELYAAQDNLNDAWMVAKIQLGSALLPGLTKLIEIGSSLLNTTLVPLAAWFNGMPDWAKVAVISFGGLVLGLGSLIGPGLQLLGTLGQISLLLGPTGIIKAIPPLVAGLQSLGAAAWASLGPWAALAAAILFLVKVISDNWGTISKALAIVGYKTLGIDPRWAANTQDSGALNVAGWNAALGNKASGGKVFAGQPFWAGERGPEPILPLVDGMVIPNNMAMGGGGSTVVYLTYAPTISTASQDEVNKIAYLLDEALRRRRKYA